MEYNKIILGDEDNDRVQPSTIIKNKKVWSFVFVFEILILLVIPIPAYDKFIKGETIILNETKTTQVFYLNDILFSMMFLRFYFLFRTLMKYGRYTEAYSR